MICIPSNGFATTFAGDSETLSVALRKSGMTVDDWSEYNLYFNAKISPDDTDEESVIQKFSGTGIIVTDGRAEIDIVPQDTREQEDVTLYCDIRGENIATGARHVFANFLWKLNTPVTKHTDASIVIYTSYPPS